MDRVPPMVEIPTSVVLEQMGLTSENCFVYRDLTSYLMCEVNLICCHCNELYTHICMCPSQQKLNLLLKHAY